MSPPTARAITAKRQSKRQSKHQSRRAVKHEPLGRPAFPSNVIRPGSQATDPVKIVMATVPERPAMQLMPTDPATGRAIQAPVAAAPIAPIAKVTKSRGKVRSRSTPPRAVPPSAGKPVVRAEGVRKGSTTRAPDAPAVTPPSTPSTTTRG